ncbi:hypothetical protein B0H16DRAFT_228185 [Mycena metata]|uniref:Uncharacterized protein n=1 Tax=Mycena metata TaxID=1033252 RepID=A0AAD7HVR1_9AGAR|nr:hypothetical protein B0H16DRAFT_228185 [Mycena metata]
MLCSHLSYNRIIPHTSDVLWLLLGFFMHRTQTTYICGQPNNTNLRNTMVFNRDSHMKLTGACSKAVGFLGGCKHLLREISRESRLITRDSSVFNEIEVQTSS